MQSSELSMHMNVLPSPKPGSRRTLYILASVFFLPFIIGTSLFWLDWRPAGFSNHGELLQPPRSLPASGLARIDGTPLPVSELRGKWLLTLLISDTCGLDCLATLTQMRQLHLALGKEQKRVLPVLLVRQHPRISDDSGLKELTNQFPDLLVAVVQTLEDQQWQNALASDAHSIHVVDPFGNVMMRHGSQVPQRKVLKDVERLLKYSWVR